MDSHKSPLIAARFWQQTVTTFARFKVIDQTWMVEDANSEFSAVLSDSDIRFSGSPQRTSWTLYEGDRHARVHSIAPVINELAIEMFHVVAIFRTFAFGNPDQWIDYLRQIDQQYELMHEH